jgi:chemotaxis protein MotB
MKTFFAIAASSLLLYGCVSQKKYAELEAENDRLQSAVPVLDARQSAEARMIQELQTKVQQQSIELQEMHRNQKEYSRMMEAGNMPQPTQEQLRMYEMKQAEAMHASMEAGMDPMNPRQSEVEMDFQRQSFENRLAFEALKSALSNYNAKQVQLSQRGGGAVMSIAIKECFEPGSSELSDLGKSLMTKIGVALEGNSPLFYRVLVVTEKGDHKNANAQAAAIYASLAGQKGKVRLPQSVGSASCDVMRAFSTMTCDRIDFVFEQDYASLMPRLEESLQR